jgi:isocitrate/isopropylmalate dehydrogenase
MPSHIHQVAKVHRIACIPGDGIGVDITEAAIQVLTQLAKTLGGFEFEFTSFDWSSKNFLERGWYMPPDGLEQLKKFDAIYFGAVGWPDVPDHISLWGLILPIRKTLNQYVNVRPTRILEGTKSPLDGCSRDKLDWVIIRENSEGEYSGQGGTSHEDSPHAIATEVSIFTRVGIERIMRFAFETARSRPRKKLTMVTKSNAQRHGMVLWDKVFYEVAKEYEDVEIDKMLVDAMTVRMVLQPQTMDTIVATNLHAGRGVVRQYRYCTKQQLGSYAGKSIHVRADTWFCPGHRWERDSQSCGGFLECGGDGAMGWRREGGRWTHESCRKRYRARCQDEGSRGRREYKGRHGGSLQRD